MSAQAHGSAAEEAARLLEALERAAAAWSRGRVAEPEPPSDHVDQAAADDCTSPPPAGAFHTTTCGVCPLCRALVRLGDGRPEVLAHLADATSALAAAVAALVAERPQPGTARPETRRRSEHIDIGD